MKEPLTGRSCGMLKMDKELLPHVIYLLNLPWFESNCTIYIPQNEISNPLTCKIHFLLIFRHFII